MTLLEIKQEKPERSKRDLLREQLGDWTARARRRPALVFLVALALAAAAVGTVWLVQRERALPDGVVAEVRGEQITTEDLNEQVDTLGALYGLEKPSGGKDLRSFWKAAAQAAVMTRVIDLAATKEGVSASQAEVSKALSDYLNALYDGAPDAGQQFTTALANAGTSKAAVEDELRRRLVDSRLQDKITSKVDEPTDAEVKAAFTERKCTMSVAETRRLRNIVVSTQVEAASARAELDQGADFATVAKTMSADTSTAANGGLIGDVAKDQLEADYGKQAFAAGTGKLFGPVRTRSGWNVGKVEAVEPAHAVAYEQVAAALTQQLAIEAESAAWRSYLRKQMKADQIRYAEKYEPANVYSIPNGVASWSEDQKDLCSPVGGQQ
ncbi:peptidyl-prolyl cis-trans isomerase [Nocardioides sp. YJ-D4]